MRQDFSAFSEPIDINSLSSVPSCEYSLSAKQISDFQIDGFVVGQRAISKEFIDRLLEDLNDLMIPGHVGEELWYE